PVHAAVEVRLAVDGGEGRQVRRQQDDFRVDGGVDVELGAGGVGVEVGPQTRPRANHRVVPGQLRRYVHEGAAAGGSGRAGAAHREARGEPRVQAVVDRRFDRRREVDVPFSAVA